MSGPKVKWTYESVDRETYAASGSRVVQLTSAPVISNNIYCEQPYCTSEGGRFAFIRMLYSPLGPSVSLYLCDLETRRLALIEPEVHPGIACCKYSGVIYYVAMRRGSKELVRVNLEDLQKEAVFDLEGVPPFRTIGSVSPDHRYYVNLHIPKPNLCQIIRLDLEKGEWQVIHEKRDIINPHPQYEPSSGRDILIQHNRGGLVDEDGNIVRLVGDEGATLYLIDSGGGNYRPLPVGKPYTNAITGHECWIGNTGRVLLTVSASPEEAVRSGNLLAVKPGDEYPHTVSKGYMLNHISVSRDGRFFVGDAWNRPGKPIVVGSIETGRCRVLCVSGASGGRPQYTHPHPYFTGDNRWVIFNSDRTGIPHIYAASVSEDLLSSLED
ncbi:MAG: hypothetical protein AYL32_004800 [Candidatus Bathyarchaeota archaeon B26-2]|nr:MAG: hypothetical protein AYL32_004800 [Candidatus Bathyarchaeota archaeon B26-2]